MALQRVRAMEALNTDTQIQNCNSGLIKVLMILNLIIVVSLLLRNIRKSVFFLGSTLFSKLGENKVILGRHKIICLTKFESIHWEYTFIQINR